jgi:hypothetical protein
MNKNLKTISFAFAMFAVVGMISSTSIAFADDDEVELEAPLTLTSGVGTGEASFEVEDPDSELEVEVEGQTPGDNCDVSINGNPVGTFVIDDEGEGELELVPSPITPIAGDVITVNLVCDSGNSEFEGEFAIEADEEDDDDEEDDEDDDDEDDDDESEESHKVKVNHRRR